VSVFLSFTVLGIVTGAVYGILATGLVVTYNTTGVFNFAQGAVGMVAAFSYWQLWQDWHWPFLLAIAFIVFVEAPLLAIVVEFVLMRRIHGATVERSLMVTLGLLVILLGIATIFWSSPDVVRSVPAYFTAADGTVASVHLFGANGVTLEDQQIMIVVVAAVVAVLLSVFLRRFRLGVAMRAVVDDPELVAMAGAKPYRMSQMGWALGFMLAAIAGVLIAPLVGQTGLTSDQLTLLALNGFAAAVVGRLRNLPMTFVGALMLGLITQYCVGYLPGHINPGLTSVLTEVVPVLFLFVVLLVIPAARLAPAGRLAVRPAPKVVTARQSVAGAVLLVAGMVVLAAIVGETALSTLSQGLAFGIVGLSLVLLVGFAGQVSLCQLTFMGIGAFTMGKVFGGDSWWGLLLAVVVSGAVGALVALPALRLRGLYLALATLAFGEVMYSAFFDNSSVISDGTSIGVGRLPLPFMHGVGDRAELVQVAVVAALCAVLVGLVRRSAFGRRLSRPELGAHQDDRLHPLGRHGRPRWRLLRGPAGRHRRQRRAVHREPDPAPLRRHLGDPHPHRRVARRPDGGGAPRAPDAPAGVAGRPHGPGRRHRDRAARPQPRRDPRHGVVDEAGAIALRRQGGIGGRDPPGPRGGPCRLRTSTPPPPQTRHPPSGSTT
jgi:branched-chain amino acid transport system permease protein